MANKKNILPLIPLRGLTLFPGMVLHFDVGRKKSIAAVEYAMSSDQLVFLSYQKDIMTENPTKNDVSKIGVVAEVKQILRLPDGNIRVLVEGLFRAGMTGFFDEEKFLTASVVKKADIRCDDFVEEQVLMRKIQRLLEDYFSLYEKMNPEIAASMLEIEDAGELADITAMNFPLKPHEKQIILEELDVRTRMEKLIALMENENNIMEVEQGVMSKLRSSLDKNQRDYILREQMKVIQEELGDFESGQVEADDYRKKAETRNLPKEVSEKLEEEFARLSRLSIHSQEYGVVQNYIETVLAMPWEISTEENKDIKLAKKILERDHYGLEKVKERILEYLAVKSLSNEAKGSIICLAGPPGTGKTSIAKSLAEALGRKYVRVSLGGIQNEAEIRGHRKTYVGAMPGRIVAALKQAGSHNPLILLDEIDKMSSDFRGDPTAAMLEVLDPEQNKGFRDHFLELPFDLSKVLFVATANSVENIPMPLYDRMDIIEISGYTEDEKMGIAKKYLFPKQQKENGLNPEMIKIPAKTMKLLIEGYTRESGVRTLERKLGAICRKAAKEIVEEKKDCITVNDAVLEKYLGGRVFLYDHIEKEDLIGAATGLAWTESGGDTLSIEVNIMKGSGKLELTGNLGEVMKESAMAAHSFIRANAEALGINEDFYKEKDIHIHVPEGAIPKDGPSAGITMATAIISALSGVRVKRNVAMTGEITLRGKVLPIGGLREKSLAAYRMGIRKVIVPFENKKDFEELPDKIKNEIEFVFAKSMKTVLENAFSGGADRWNLSMLNF
ncbi:MAG: endopeptidase La [Clostridia bacterium]|nr:endopeptidase La [Clostridia bacterium]